MTACADVTYTMRASTASDAEVGDMLWNTKGGEGHVLVAAAPCGSLHNGHRVDCGCGGWGTQPCTSTVLICECGEDDSFRDHHYIMLVGRQEARESASQRRRGPQVVAEGESNLASRGV